MPRIFDYLTLAENFIKDRRANVAIMAAFSLLPILAAVGAAVDYSRIYHTQSKMTSALDTAVLSAAKGLSSGALTDDQVEDHIRAMLTANLGASGANGLSYSITGFVNNQADGTLSADLQAELPMAMMSLVNIDSQTINTSVEAVYGNQNVELTMMLDVTGSMYGSKIANLKSAAKDAITILLPAESANKKKIRIGLVPYSNSVNANPYAYDVTDSNSDRCVTGRSGKNKWTDAAPSLIPIGADPRAVDYDYCPSRALRPMTSNRSKLLADINAYHAGGSTAGHLGVAWSYYMLSPNWDSVWPAESKPGSYGNDKTLKVALLMTDGEFNTYYEGTTGRPWSSANRVLANNAAKKLCKNMRKDGIVIYSIAFEAPASAQAILKRCATPNTEDNQYYYNAKNGAQLKLAFQAIARNIQNLRLSR